MKMFHCVSLLVLMLAFGGAWASDDHPEENYNMSQDLKSTPHTLDQIFQGGARILFNEEVNGGYRGFNHIGNIVQPSFAQKVDFLKVYDTAGGLEVLAREIAINSEMIIKAGVNEMFADSYCKLLLADDGIKVDADPEATHAAETFVGGITGHRMAVTESRMTDEQADDLTVYNVTDAALVVENTGYKKVKVNGRWLIELLVDTLKDKHLRIGTGGTAVVAYEYTKLASMDIAALSKTRKVGQIIFEAVSDSGASFDLFHTKCELGPDGDFGLDTKQASVAKFQFAMLKDAVGNPGYPYGRLRHYGKTDTGTSPI